jgi:hypothetical protein
VPKVAWVDCLSNELPTGRSATPPRVRRRPARPT